MKRLSRKRSILEVRSRDECLPWALSETPLLQDQDERAGVGLFVGGLGGTREHNLDAEVVPCAGDRGTSRP